MERDAPRTASNRATTYFDDVEVDGNLNVKGSVTITGEDLNRRFADVLEAIAANHGAVLARFDRIDARFDRIDARFDRIDARSDRIEGKLDQLLSREEVQP